MFLIWKETFGSKFVTLFLVGNFENLKCCFCDYKLWSVRPQTDLIHHVESLWCRGSKCVDPVFFSFESGYFSLLAEGVKANEVEDFDFYIIFSIMVHL